MVSTWNYNMDEQECWSGSKQLPSRKGWKSLGSLGRKLGNIPWIPGVLSPGAAGMEGRAVALQEWGVPHISGNEQ